MIRLIRRPLAEGMRAFARREGPDVLIVVNADMRPAVQKAAVRMATAAARRAGWITSRAPAGIGAGGIGIALLRQLRRAVTAHLAGAVTGTAAIGTTALVAATVITASPPVSPAARFPGPRPSASAAHHRRRRVSRARGPLPVTGTAPGQPHGPRRHHHPRPKGHPSRTASPSPGPGSSSPGPTGSRSPSPTSSPSPAASAPSCVIVLGLKVCL